MDPREYMRDLADRLVQERERVEARHVSPPPPEDPWSAHWLRRSDYPDRVVKSWENSVMPPQSLDGVREAMGSRMMRYAQDGGERILLIRVPAGIGKSHTAVSAIQKVARSDQRVMYAAGRHDYWDDLTRFTHFDRDVWYHWLPISEGDESRGIPETCRYADQMRLWLRRGYSSIDLCKQLCLLGGYMNHCPYRVQARRKESIIFAMHHHLVYGMSIDDYDLAVIDELPLQAFVKTTGPFVGQIVPRKGIIPRSGASGPMMELFKWLDFLVESQPKSIRGRDLMEVIGNVLSDAYTQAGEFKLALPVVPAVTSPDDVEKVDYYYWKELLEILTPEFAWWEKGEQHWVSRTRTIPKVGLQMLTRNHVWDNLPQKVVVLDATGESRFYELLLGRPVEVYNPTVDRPGKIYQIVNRLNGTGTILRKKEGGRGRELAPRGVELLELSRTIAARYEGRVGVVTFKDAAPEFEKEFGIGNVMHFGGLRGSNVFLAGSDGSLSVDCLIVAGGYCPPPTAMVDMAAALFQARREPFLRRDEEGGIISPWTPAPVAYRLRDGGTAWRLVTGFWRDPELSLVMEQLRQAEIVQAMHRARPNTREVDVWVLTSTPTFEALDGVYQSLSEAGISPERHGDYGIPPKHWPKVHQALHDAPTDAWITNADLADIAGIEPESVAKQKWTFSIASHCDGWEVEERREVGDPLNDRGGRPSVGLVRKE